MGWYEMCPLHILNNISTGLPKWAVYVTSPCHLENGVCLSVLYLLSLCFILFQSYSTVRNILEWLDPELEGFRIDMDKEYGVNCSDINLSKLWGHMDVFAFSHFFGWLMKALIVRHYGILWTISVMWEITEVMILKKGTEHL
ncbi:phosphatidylserine synthase-like [Artemia franciscana]|uniref:Phosphatidylserine synthase n=1 Tax=Artemia franciscana TaxID=6661 RepID=A0AA88HTT6_ARTSF|nr:hypothetical protein QYM36_009525 [Artemia franciscana]